MTEYASLLPATVIAEMLGAPVAMSRQFLAWGAEAARSLDAGLSLSEFRRSERGLRALQRWMEGHFAHLRAHPGDDILSTLVHAPTTRRASSPRTSSRPPRCCCSPRASRPR